MSDDPNFWASLGIRLPDLIGGTAGGTAAAVAFKRSGVTSIISSVLVGALTASYMTAWVTQYLGTFAGGVSFVVGLGSMAICQGLGAMITKWLPTITKDGNP